MCGRITRSGVSLSCQMQTTIYGEYWRRQNRQLMRHKPIGQDNWEHGNPYNQKKAIMRKQMIEFDIVDLGSAVR